MLVVAGDAEVSIVLVCCGLVLSKAEKQERNDRQ
jgi:hypothetical protein